MKNKTAVCVCVYFNNLPKSYNSAKRKVNRIYSNLLYSEKFESTFNVLESESE